MRANTDTKISSTANVIYDFVNYIYNSSKRGGGIIKYIDENNKDNYKSSGSNDYAVSQILRAGVSWNGKDVTNKPAKVTYSFYHWNDWPDAKELTNEQKVAVKKSLKAWEDVANITFEEVAPEVESHINFGNYNGNVHTKVEGGLTHVCSYACAYLPQSDFYKAGQVWFNFGNNSSNLSLSLGGYNRQVIVHEIGHAIGLKHPGKYSEGNNPLYSKHASYGEDTRQFSVMSYWSEKHLYADFGGYYSSAPLIDDIPAIQTLYSPNMSTRSSNTTYGFYSNTERDWYTILDSSQQVIFSVWDAGGDDTFNFSLYKEDQRINLREGSFSDIGKLKGNISIAKGVSIEHAVGGRGNDIIVGNDKNNTIIGGHGNDIIFGGKGKDTLWGDFKNANESDFGVDIFFYDSLEDSTFSLPDLIKDFQTGKDKIDISALFKKYKSDKSVHSDFYFNNINGKLPEGKLTLKYLPDEKITELQANLDQDDAVDFLIKIYGTVNYSTDIII